MKKDEIRHDGIVLSAEGEKLQVRILQASTCSSCSAAQLCRSSEAKEKVVEAVAEDGQQLKPGDNVVVVGQMGQGLKATLWAYVVPLVLMMAAIVTTIALTDNEDLGAVVGIAVLAPYYMGLSTQKKRLKRKFSFVARRKE